MRRGLSNDPMRSGSGCASTVARTSLCTGRQRAGRPRL